MKKAQGNVNTEEFATLLCYWLAKQMTSEKVKDTAEMFSIDVSNKQNLVRLFNELFGLNMWLVVHTCERVFDDVDKRNECLDRFHNLVYQEFFKDEDMDFSEWLGGLSAKYLEYNKARESEAPLGPAFALATEVNKNLFGELNLDAFVQFAIGRYITASINALEGALKQYKVS